MPGRPSGEVMPTSSGSDAAAQETEKSQSAEAGQSPSVASRTSCSQFRLRRPKRTAWIRKADRCKLIRTFQEVMPGRTSGEVRLLRRKPFRSTVMGRPSTDKSIVKEIRSRTGALRDDGTGTVA